jgi:hypothetical protein
MTDQGAAQRPGFEMPPDDPAAYPRALRLGRAAFRRIGSVAKALYIATGIATGIGLAAHLGGLDPWVASGVALVAAVAAVAVVALPFRDAALRAATEIASNHQVREAREWHEETGTRMPRGRAAIRRWLEAHPDTVGRGTLLTVLGSFADAEAYWRSHPASTEGEAFGVEVQRETAVLLSGGAPDLERLRVLWPTIRDPLERENRRECLALLEAQALVESGADPIAIVAAARRETGPVMWRVRIPFVLGFHIALAVVPVAIISAARVLFAG